MSYTKINCIAFFDKLMTHDRVKDLAANISIIRVVYFAPFEASNDFYLVKDDGTRILSPSFENLDSFTKVILLAKSGNFGATVDIPHGTKSFQCYFSNNLTPCSICGMPATTDGECYDCRFPRNSEQKSKCTEKVY